MNETIVKQILDFIEKTGGILLKSGFEISVRYVIADAIGNLIASGISLVGLIFCVFKLIKLITKEKSLESDRDSMMALVYLIASIVLLVTFTGFSPIESIKMLISPEWFAIKNIVSIVK